MNLLCSLFCFVSSYASFSPPYISYLKNWGLVNTAAVSHVHAIDAWTLTEGSSRVIVAVIDTGIDYEHPQLKENIIPGWNFVSNEEKANDEHGHGTHIAGIIGAVPSSVTGISGVAHKVSLMPLKYYSAALPGSANLKNTIRAIEFAVEHKVNIINYSAGGPEFSEDEYLALKKAERAGILVVAAAGNERQDSGLVENYYYPSAYGLSNIITVTAHTIVNEKLRSSNWSKRKVDVSAPGENIYSALPHKAYGYMSGTSQATAMVSGIAVLLKACKPSITAVEMKSIIEKTVVPIESMKSQSKSGGIVDAYRALAVVAGKKGCAH
jgi:thermitase